MTLNKPVRRECSFEMFIDGCVNILAREKTTVAKVMKCRSVGLDCDFVAHGETEAQVMEKVAEHAKKDHGMHEIPEDVATKVRAAIRNE